MDEWITCPQWGMGNNTGAEMYRNASHFFEAVHVMSRPEQDLKTITYRQGHQCWAKFVLIAQSTNQVVFSPSVMILWSAKKRDGKPSRDTSRKLSGSNVWELLWTISMTTHFWPEAVTAVFCRLKRLRWHVAVDDDCFLAPFTRLQFDFTCVPRLRPGEGSVAVSVEAKKRSHPSSVAAESASAVVLWHLGQRRGYTATGDDASDHDEVLLNTHCELPRQWRRTIWVHNWKLECLESERWIKKDRRKGYWIHRPMQRRSDCVLRILITIHQN